MERLCDSCGTPYVAVRAHSRFCSTRCRVAAAAKRARDGEAPAPQPAMAPVAEPAEGDGPVTAATRAELRAAGRLDCSAGQKALALAALIDAPPHGTFGSVAGWSKEHGAAMAAALVDVKPAQRSTLDEIKARRDAKRGA